MKDNYLTQKDIDNLNIYFINLSNLETVSYQRQWILRSAVFFNNDKLNDLKKSRKILVKEKYYLFQNYKDFNFFYNKRILF
jgi:hypothetical protein